MTDANFKSTLTLRSIIATTAISVTPILHLSNGTQFTLPAVQLQPNGTAIVDLNAALQSQGIAPYATLSGWAEVQYNWPWDPICATIRNLDVTHSLVFPYNLRGIPPPKPNATPAGNTVEGMWWKQEPNVTGSVALANTTGQAIAAALQVSDSNATPLGQYTTTISPYGMKTINLTELQYTTSLAGGLTVTYSGLPTDLIVNGALEDQSSGYSAVMPFAATPVQASKAAPTSFAELGLMVGAPDPMMQFPPSLVFTPYSVVRNISNVAVSAVPTLWWMAGGSAQSAELPAINLPPYHSQSLDVRALLIGAGLKNYSGSVNLVFDVQGKPGSLLPVSGSVDQTNNYVFEAVPRGIATTASRSVSYWSTGNGDDTMVTLWNPADEPQDLVFTINHSAGHYRYPIHLAPRATYSFNLSEVSKSSMPDAEGNLVPTSVHEGSARLTGNSHMHDEQILVAMDVETYNVRKATCQPFCLTCDGYTYGYVDQAPFSMAVNGQTQEYFYGMYDDTYPEYDSNAGWNSTDSNVFYAFGSDYSTSVTGVDVGTASLLAWDDTSPSYVFDDCSGLYWMCPEANGISGSATGNVRPTVQFIGGLSYIFAGSDPSVTGFNLEQVQGSPNGGTYSWSATGPASISFSPNNSASAGTPTLSSSGNSASQLDTTLTVNYALNGTSAQPPATKAITVRLFAFLQQAGSIQIIPLSGPTTYGYTSYVYYNVFTDPGGQILQPGFDGISTYESVTLTSTNFPVTDVTGTGATVSSQVEDQLSVIADSPLPSNFSATSDQYLGVGGFVIRHNTLTQTASGPSVNNLGPYN